MKKSPPLAVKLPEHITENQLYNSFRLEYSINSNTGSPEHLRTLTIDGKGYEIDEIKEIGISYDWSNVAYFEDSCLLQLLTMQQMILGEGIAATHFDKEKFACRETVKKQLLLAGYFTQWISPLFKTTEKEKYQLSILDFRDIGESLNTQHEILPIIVSRGYKSLSNSSPELDVVNYFEQNVALNVFADQKEGHRKRTLIENGEFKHVILRQCRKNIIEHSLSTVSFSMARIIRLKEFKKIWNIYFESLKNYFDDDFYNLIKDSKGDPVIIISTIDNGIGIVKSLEKTWDKSFWSGGKNKEDTKHFYRNAIESNKAFKDYNKQQKVLEFAFTPAGSSKSDKLRSIEKPGLNKVDQITKNEKGILEVTSGQHRILHSPNSKTNPQCFSPFNFGTLIKNLIPLREELVEDYELYSSLKNFRFNKTLQPDKPEEIEDLKESWEIYINEEPETRIKKIIDLLEKNILTKLKSSLEIPYILLNWAYVSWDEHDLSIFLLKIRGLFSSHGNLLRPIIHVNVPHHYYLLATEAIAEYSRNPENLTLCFFEGTERWGWIGLPHDPKKGEIIEKNFNNFLTKKPHEYITLRGKSNEEYSILHHYLNSKPEFFEEIVVPSSDGTESFTGRYKLKIDIEQIKSKISYTFTSELKSVLNSDFCRLTPETLNIKNGGGRKRTNKLIRLPNGLLVDTFFRCDGLLNNPDRKFQKKLIKELIESAIQIENVSSEKINIIISCTSPTHWFVHQIADGLTSKNRHCAHFVAKRHTFFETELKETNIPNNLNALIFTDVLSTGRVAETMINALKEKDFKILGLIALLDTRSNNERQKHTFLDNAIPSERQMILARELGVKKWHNTTKEAGWAVDPETLEPKPIKKEKEALQDKYFSGIGALAFPGKDAKEILKNSGALKNGHLKHGSHHSEYGCDIKKILGLPSLRSQIGNRLNIYIEKSNFDLIICPNNSNAYLLLNIIREIRGTPAKNIPVRIALCRYIAGEKTYSLSLGKGLDINNIKKILIIDDGVVTGTSLKSVITEILMRFASQKKDTLKEIHMTVFLNEMSPVKTKFWDKIGGCDPNIFFEKKIIKKNTKKRGFINPDVFFNAFISYPHPVYKNDNCPICLKEREYLANSIDDTKTPFERAFYENWANDLKLLDIYHGCIEEFGQKENLSEIQNFTKEREKSRSIIEILEFNTLLQKEYNLDDLINKTSYEKGNITYSKTQFLKSLLRVRNTALLENQERQTIRNLIDQIKLSDFNHALSLLKVLLEDDKQYNRLKTNDFLDIVAWSAKHLKEVEFVGGIIAYVRNFYNSNKTGAHEDKDKIDTNLSQLANTMAGIEKKNIEIIREYLIHGEYFSLGDSLLILRDIAFAKIGHKYLEDSTKNMKNKIDECLKNISSQKTFIDLRNHAFNFKQRTQKIEKAIKVISNKTMIFTKKEKKDNDDFWENFNEKMSPLLDKKLFEKEPKKLIITEASHSLNGWYDKLFIPPNALLHKILDSYLIKIQHLLDSATKDAINDFPSSIRKSDYELRIPTADIEIEKIKIFCDESILSRVLKDIITNFGKHVVPKLKIDRHFPVLKFIVEKETEKQEIKIIIQDNGGGIPENKIKKLHKTFNEIGEFGCKADIINSPQGASIILKMWYKKG